MGLWATHRAAAPSKRMDLAVCRAVVMGDNETGELCVGGWICMDICGYVWICVDMCGYVWICVDMCICAEMGMVVHVHVYVSM